ncbi:MAG: hypothetical protein EPO28_08870 [Saprospiraceae bacterium]|nr:MAG: hypothetical protein EPO28_08870 [Saprospiraceae bacterium]
MQTKKRNAPKGQVSFQPGMRFGNIINVRYSMGHVTWQDNDNRRANIKNQVTVGIILQELHH